MVANMKNKQISKKIAQQTSRRLKPCPPRLERLLGIVNLIPPGIELPDMEAMSGENLKRLNDQRFAFGPIEARPATTGDDAEDWRRVTEYAQRAIGKLDHVMAENERIDEELRKDAYLLEAIEKCLKGLPPAFRQYVEQDSQGSQHGDKYKPYLLLHRYNFARNARKNLSEIIDRYKRSKSDDPLYKGFSASVFAITATVRISSEGLIEFEKDEFLRAIEDVEVERLRCCAICGKYFWAGRLDQQCCSKNCANALRNRRWRENSKEYYATRVLKENSAQANQDSEKER